jgi:hypothetical protein
MGSDASIGTNSRDFHVIAAADTSVTRGRVMKSPRSRCRREDLGHASKHFREPDGVSESTVEQVAELTHLMFEGFD